MGYKSTKYRYMNLTDKVNVITNIKRTYVNLIHQNKRLS